VKFQLQPLLKTSHVSLSKHKRNITAELLWSFSDLLKSWVNVVKRQSVEATIAKYSKHYGLCQITTTHSKATYSMQYLTQGSG